MLALLTILVPIAVGLVMLAVKSENVTTSKAIGAVVAALTFVAALLMQSGGAEVSIRWLSRPFESALHFGATGISILARVAADRVHV